MSLTLNATLATAQDNDSRKPLVEIVSSQRDDEIPFDGAFLTSSTDDEISPNVIQHSSGRLVEVHWEDSVGGSLKFVYTDTARTEFTTVSHVVASVLAVSLCEMTDGNVLVTLLQEYGGNYHITSRIISVLGVAVSGPHAVGNWANTIFTGDTWVQLVGATYHLYYTKESAPNYYIYKRTSADGITWSGEVAQTITGLTTTWKLRNVSALEISTGDLWLWFDVQDATGPAGEELRNLYYTVSADAGATWAAAVNVLPATLYGDVNYNPVAIQKAAATMNLIFTRARSVMHMDKNSTGWAYPAALYSDYSNGLSWDAANRKVYVINFSNSRLVSVLQVDIDSWTVTDTWTDITAPAFPAWMCGSADIIAGGIDTGNAAVVHDGHDIVVKSTSNKCFWHLDGDANTIDAYYFADIPAETITANVSSSSVPAGEIGHFFVDKANDKIWILWPRAVGGGVGTAAFLTIGYIDLTEAAPYDFHTVVDDQGGFENQEIYGMRANIGRGSLWVDYGTNTLVVTGGVPAFSWKGCCAVFDITTGGLIHLWTGDDADFPYSGLREPTVYDGKIYAGINEYTSGYGQSTFRGLCEIDIATGVISTHRPTYETLDDYFFTRPVITENDVLVMTHDLYGIVLFDTVGKSWQIFNNENVSGLTLAGNEDFGEAQTAYDPVGNLIMQGDPADGILMFSTNGAIKQVWQSEATEAGGIWTFGAKTLLVQGFSDYAPGACVELGTTAMYVFWVNENVDTNELSIKWDSDLTTTDISGYILDSVDVVTSESISGSPATLSFSVSHGHLFDPFNLSSLIALLLKKGRQVSIRWGENVAGVPFWQEAGDFFVTDTKISFKKGDYPTMSVNAGDQSSLWGHNHVDATDNYSSTPQDILADLVDVFANIDLADTNFPTLSASVLIHQWIDSDLIDIINQICNRFGYYFRFEVDGKASASLISVTAAVDHTYTDNTKVLEFTPDDKYSDHTNQVVVQGQELDETQVTFPEERVGNVAGTLGWWGCSKDHKVWFSKDKNKRCINPRIDVVETSTSIGFSLQGKGSESLSEAPAAADNKYCIVEVDAPSLIPELTAAITTYGIGNLLGDKVEEGVTVPFGRRIEGGGLLAAMLVLGSVKQYQIDVYAQPLGSVRRSLQGQWDDDEHQALINAVVKQTFEDPLCYTQSECEDVADFEGMVAQAQRRRATWSKITHLQDEAGDTIQIVHPYSGENLILFVTDLERRFRKADNGGYFTDTISGWVR